VVGHHIRRMDGGRLTTGADLSREGGERKDIYKHSGEMHAGKQVTYQLGLPDSLQNNGCFAYLFIVCHI
jgi:hypothetical protein